MIATFKHLAVSLKDGQQILFDPLCTFDFHFYSKRNWAVFIYDCAGNLICSLSHHIIKKGGLGYVC